MQHLEVSGAVRPLKWSLGVKWLIHNLRFAQQLINNTTIFHTGMPLQTTISRGPAAYIFTEKSLCLLRIKPIIQPIV